MAKGTLNEDGYLAELNRRLLQHEMYKEGMAFVPYPAGSSGAGMSGYSTTGPFHLTGVYAQVAHSVDRDFILKV
jgi:hypothetical protein